MTRLQLILLPIIIAAGVFPFSPASAHQPIRAEQVRALTIPGLIRQRRKA